MPEHRVKADRVRMAEIGVIQIIAEARSRVLWPIKLRIVAMQLLQQRRLLSGAEPNARAYVHLLVKPFGRVRFDVSQIRQGRVKRTAQNKLRMITACIAAQQVAIDSTAAWQAPEHGFHKTFHLVLK